VTGEQAAEVAFAHAQACRERGDRVVAGRVRRHRSKGRGERGWFGGVYVHRPIVWTPYGNSQ
jgi:hypothetical protein